MTDPADLRHRLDQLGELLQLCLSEARAVLDKLERVSADISEALPTERATTYQEVMDAAQRAKQEVESWPAWKRALSEPTDPWALPGDLAWGYDEDGWIIFDERGAGIFLWCGRECGSSRMLGRHDVRHLIDLLRRRNAAEPKAWRLA